MGAFSGFRRVFCDAGFFIALYSKKDAHHERALALFKEAHDAKSRLFTSWLMVSEALTILRYHYGFSEAFTFGQSLELYEIIMPSENLCQQALAIFNLKSQKLKISFADALSFVLLSGPLKDAPALSFDDDFRKLGLTVIR